VDTSKLEALTPAELIEITGLTVTDVTFGGDLLDTVRTMVIDADKSDAWDAPSKRDLYVHHNADVLVPNTWVRRNFQRELFLLDTGPDALAEFDAYAKRFDLWSNTDVGDLNGDYSTATQHGRAVYLAYTRAINALVDWLIDNQPEDDE
jgi:hypothetical protein